MFDKVKNRNCSKWPVPVLHYSSDSVSVACVSWEGSSSVSAVSDAALFRCTYPRSDTGLNHCPDQNPLLPYLLYNHTRKLRHCLCRNKHDQTDRSTDSRKTKKPFQKLFHRKNLLSSRCYESISIVILFAVNYKTFESYCSQ